MSLMSATSVSERLTIPAVRRGRPVPPSPAVGVPDATAVRDGVVSTAREKLTPPLAPSVEIVPFEGVSLVVAQVEALPPAQRPCYVTTRGCTAARMSGSVTLTSG